MDARTALELRGGSATAGQLSASVTKRHLARAVDRGEILQPGRGIYAVEQADPAQLRAVRLRGELSCQNAAAVHGWELLRPPQDTHVTCPRGSNRAPIPRTTMHRLGNRREPGAATGVDETLLGVARCLPVVEAVVVLDGVLRRGIREPDDLTRLAAGLARTDPRRIPFRLADPRAQSVLESAVRVGCVLAGLDVQLQIRLDGVGWVDLLVEGWLVVEADGRRTHLENFQTDRSRDATTALLGGMTLRFTHADVVDRLQETVATIATVARAGPRGRGLSDPTR